MNNENNNLNQDNQNITDNQSNMFVNVPNVETQQPSSNVENQMPSVESNPTIQTNPMPNPTINVNPQITNQPNNVNTSPINTTNNSSKNKKIVIYIVIGVVLLLIAVFIISKLNKKNEITTIIDDYSENEEKEKKLAKNVEINVVQEITGIDGNKQILISITNNNTETLNYVNAGNIKVFDSSNIQLQSGKIAAPCIQGNTTLYEVFSYETYDHYELDIENLEVTYSEAGSDDESNYKCINYDNKYTISIKKDGEENLSINLQNNTGATATFNGYILYKKNNKIVDTDFVYFAYLGNGITANDKIYIPYKYDNDKVYLDYDSTDFVLNSVD